MAKIIDIIEEEIKDFLNELEKTTDNVEEEYSLPDDASTSPMAGYGERLRSISETDS